MTGSDRISVSDTLAFRREVWKVMEPVKLKSAFYSSVPYYLFTVYITFANVLPPPDIHSIYFIQLKTVNNLTCFELPECSISVITPICH